MLMGLQLKDITVVADINENGMGENIVHLIIQVQETKLLSRLFGMLQDNKFKAWLFPQQ